MEGTGFGTQDIITGRGLGIGGFGYGGYMQAGNSALAASAHADGTGLGKSIECNSHSLEAGLNRVSDQNEETRRILQNDEIRKDISDFRISELNSSAQNNLFIAGKLADMSAANAKCCCETQLLVVKENSATRELINARALENTQRDLDRCLQEKQTQTIIAALKPATATCL